MNPSLRRGLVQLHRWLGLIVAPAIAYLALTGSTMLLRPHLEPVVDSRLHLVSACERPLPLAQLIANANERHPEGAIRQLELTGGAADATVVRYHDLRGVFVDPCSGAVLGEQQRWGGVFGTLEGLHRLRYFVDDGSVTEPITGTLSVVMGLMAIFGIALWWPRSRGHLKRSLSLRSGLHGTALQMHLHRVIGVYAAAVLLISAVGAWTFTFDWARSALYVLTRSSPPAARPKSSAGSGPKASPDALLAAARNAVPDFDRMTIVLPKGPTDSVEVQILERDAPHPNARTTLYLDPRDARLLRLEPYATSSAGHKAYRWLASLHMGYVGGVAGQIVQGAAMLMVPVLLFTGVRSFWRRRRAPKRSATAGSSREPRATPAGPSAPQIRNPYEHQRGTSEDACIDDPSFFNENTNAMKHDTRTLLEQAVSKVPEVTLGFWIIKIAATTLGETGGDWVTMSLNLGYLIGSAIFAVFFIALVAAQVKARRFHPSLYWATIVATTTLGTTLADFADRSLGIGYPGGVAIVSACLFASLVVWYWSEGTVSVRSIATPKVEWFYWITILFSQTLGTALGDWFAGTDRGGLGLGYEYGAVIFGAGLAVVAALYLWTRASRTALFWAAFVLTRPLGATLGDLLDKPVASGGMNLSRFYASLILLSFILVCLRLIPQVAAPRGHAK
jgi:uncharacterized membrane-anchored protein/uncharacterized iron-regulated membrane protein